ncbi:MAG: GNAT family N-acetyltransferase [Armatimonadota bacterium]
MSAALDLTGLWRFQPDPFQEGEGLGWTAPEYDIRCWREVRVPCVFDRCGPAMPGYEGRGWFRREVTIPADWQGKRIELHFGAVNYRARVWANGQFVGRHDDGFLPFSFPIEKYITPGETATVVVEADNERLPGEVPGLERGWRPFGGILREVTLIARDPLHLADVTVQGDAGGRFIVQVRVVNACAEAATAALSVIVTDTAGLEVARCAAEPVRLAPGEASELRCNGAVSPVSCWSPETPVLYTARLILSDVEEQHIRFGFRTIETRGEQLFLNGKPLLLLGCNRHEDSVRADLCVDLEQARADFLDMKALGMNFVRLCHYPHHPGELDLCDELGLLVMAEISLYWWHGLKEGGEHCARKLEAAKRQLTKMIARDASHPSVIFWSVSNETEESLPEVTIGNDELVRLAKALDPTRPAVHVSYHWQLGHPHFDEDDVICVNGYPTIQTRGEQCKPQHTAAQSRQWWIDGLEELHRRYPGKPILVTEFGLPALEDVAGSVVGEDLQKEAIREEFAGMTAAYICGATIWCYADHPWPEEDFLRYMHMSPYGLVTRERRRKPAYGTVKELFHARRGLPLPALGADDPNNLTVGMYRPNMENIPQYAFPAGYGIRKMRSGEGALWTDVQRDAEHWLTVDDDLFTREFGFDLEATQWRCFFIVNELGAAVGVISAWYDRDINGQDYGRIHWVAIRQACCGKGLIKPAMTHAMNVMAQWHQRAYLGTSTARIPAIKVYLDFGFLPDMTLPKAQEAWEQVQAVLRHPALEACLK